MRWFVTASDLRWEFIWLFWQITCHNFSLSNRKNHFMLPKYMQMWKDSSALPVNSQKIFRFSFRKESRFIQHYLFTNLILIVANKKYGEHQISLFSVYFKWVFFPCCKINRKKNNIATKVFVSILLLFVVVAQKKTKIKQNIDASSKQQMCRNAFNHRFHSLTNRIE